MRRRSGGNIDVYKRQGQRLGRRVAVGLDDEVAADHVVGFGIRSVTGQHLAGLQPQVATAFIGEFLAADHQAPLRQVACPSLVAGDDLLHFGGAHLDSVHGLFVQQQHVLVHRDSWVWTALTTLSALVPETNRDTAG